MEEVECKRVRMMLSADISGKKEEKCYERGGKCEVLRKVLR